MESTKLPLSTYRILDASLNRAAEGLRVIEDFLSECDLVKFAKYIPELETMERAVERAREIVRERVKRKT